MIDIQEEIIQEAYRKSGFSYQDKLYAELEKSYGFRGTGEVIKETIKEPMGSGKGDCDFITYLFGDDFERGVNKCIFWQAKRARDKVVLLERVDSGSYLDRGTYEKRKEISPKNDKKDIYKALIQLREFEINNNEEYNKSVCGLSSGSWGRVNIVITEADVHSHKGEEKLSQNVYKLHDSVDTYLIKGLENCNSIFKILIEDWKMKKRKDL